MTPIDRFNQACREAGITVGDGADGPPGFRAAFIKAFEACDRDGFEAARAQLRDPSEAVLQAAARAAFEAIPNSTWEPEARAALAAAADAIRDR